MYKKISNDVMGLFIKIFDMVIVCNMNMKEKEVNFYCKLLKIKFMRCYFYLKKNFIIEIYKVKYICI